MKLKLVLAATTLLATIHSNAQDLQSTTNGLDQPQETVTTDLDQDDATEGESFAPNKNSIFSVCINGGITFPYTDVKHTANSPVLGIGAQYAATPWIVVNADLQFGILKGGRKEEASSYYREFKNNFFYGSITGRFFPLRLALTKSSDHDIKTNIKYLGGIYVGFGAAVINNNVTTDETPEATKVRGIPSPNGLQILMPVEAGYNFPLTYLNPKYSANIYGKSLLSLNVNFRYNPSFSEKLDGYNPATPMNKNKDAFSTLTVGITYNL